MPGDRLVRVGVAAILAGSLIFLGQAGELAFGTPNDVALGVGVALFSGGIMALCVAIWSLRAVVQGRAGRIGWRICVAGMLLLALFAVELAITVALTQDLPATFVLFGLGFALLFIGHLAVAPGLRPALGRLWVLPLVAAAGIVVAITLNIDPIHDIGLFVFEGAWIALGVGLVRGHREPKAAVAPASWQV